MGGNKCELLLYLEKFVGVYECPKAGIHPSWDSAPEKKSLNWFISSTDFLRGTDRNCVHNLVTSSVPQTSQAIKSSIFLSVSSGHFIFRLKLVCNSSVQNAKLFPAFGAPGCSSIEEIKNFWFKLRAQSNSDSFISRNIFNILKEMLFCSGHWNLYGSSEQDVLMQLDTPGADAV